MICASYRKYLPLEQQNGASWQWLLRDIANVLSPTTEVEAFSFSSHGPSLIAIDQNGRPITSPHNPIHRIRPEIKQFCQGDSFYLPLARTIWSLFREEQRRQVACILPPANYICYLLTGETTVPIPEHYAMFYWPSTASALDQQFLHLLPKLCAFSDKVGQVQSPEAFQPKLAQLQGTPVFCPGVDFFAAEAGLSCSAENLLRNHTGTSEGFNLLLPSIPELQNKSEDIKFPPGYFLNHHVISKRPLLSHIQEDSGKIFDQLFQLWHKNPQHDSELYCASYQCSQKNTMLQNILGNHSARELAQANRFATHFSQSGLSCSEFFPRLERELGNLTQVDFGQIGLYTVQLLVQYFTLRCETIFELYQQFVGSKWMHSKQVLLSGGQAYYPIWLAWKARHSGMTIHTPSICDAEFIGAAAICYHKLGYFASIDQASKQLLKISQTYQPVEPSPHLE